MNKVLLSLGSNLSSRKLNIKSCVEFLNNAKKIDVIGVSSLYESSPMYNFEQDNFINCVIEIKTPLKPLELITLPRLSANRLRSPYICQKLY